MTLLGATIGIPMGLAYPFPAMIKLGFIFGLISSMSAIIYGVRYRSEFKGQVLAVIGVVVWSFVGMIGLGTGT